LAQPAKEAQRVGGQGQRQQRGGGPAEELGDRMREKRSDPAEVSSYISVSVKLGVAFGGEGAGEEDSDKEKYDPANLTGQRRARRFIAPVRARAS
jgi:hypothetical protein